MEKYKSLERASEASQPPAAHPPGILERPVVLVLNRNWQAINIRTPADAFCQMAAGNSTALDISEAGLRPVRWEDWLDLPVRPWDAAIGTPRGPIRIPTVLVLARYDKVPRKRPKLSARSIRERDGNRCQYTGRVLAPGEGSIDHILPRSRGGGTSWENCVWSSKQVNGRKGDRLPNEAGLTLLSVPKPPPEMPVTWALRNNHGIRDWELFLPRK
ncbi:MAG: HNH endonuclease [Verrucomicrobia bacterium]|nr:HNH endonuclease [Verrucomicrobiota bacterium]